MNNLNGTHIKKHKKQHNTENKDKLMLGDEREVFSLTALKTQQAAALSWKNSSHIVLCCASLKIAFVFFYDCGRHKLPGPFAIIMFSQQLSALLVGYCSK